MADISNLANLQSTEPLDWEKYADAKEAPQPPRKGRYQLRAPDSFTFTATAAGFLQAQVDPTVVGPSHPGYSLRFQRVSAKPFTRSGVKVSQLGDYLRAVGMAVRPTTPQEQANAIESTAGRIFTADLDWEVYCKGCKFTLKGEENFPADGNGGHLPVIKCPNCKATSVDAAGAEVVTPVNLRANVRIDRFVAAS